MPGTNQSSARIIKDATGAAFITLKPDKQSCIQYYICKKTMPK